eukprot:1418554-Rhodomonas_salina.2
MLVPFARSPGEKGWGGSRLVCVDVSERLGTRVETEVSIAEASHQGIARRLVLDNFRESNVKSKSKMGRDPRSRTRSRTNPSGKKRNGSGFIPSIISPAGPSVFSACARMLFTPGSAEHARSVPGIA